MLHGLLDWAPHSYPIKSSLDVAFSLVLFIAAAAFAKQEHRLLIAVCFLGAVFPDLVDLGPAIACKYLGCSAPTLKIFPWHWYRYSGSIYDDSKKLASLVCHFAVVVLSASLLYLFRSSLFRLRKEVT